MIIAGTDFAMILIAIVIPKESHAEMLLKFMV